MAQRFKKRVKSQASKRVSKKLPQRGVQPSVQEKTGKLSLPEKAFLSFFGMGYSKKMPGTMGSFLATLTLPFLLYTKMLPIVVIALFIVGWTLSARAVRVLKKEDPQFIVIDEVVGIGVTLMIAPYATLFNLILVFAFFRLFDIAKPYPVSFADKKLGGGFGIMMDDVVAGAYAGAAIQVLYYFLSV